MSYPAINLLINNVVEWVIQLMSLWFSVGASAIYSDWVIVCVSRSPRVTRSPCGASRHTQCSCRPAQLIYVTVGARLSRTESMLSCELWADGLIKCFAIAPRIHITYSSPLLSPSPGLYLGHAWVDQHTATSAPLWWFASRPSGSESGAIDCDKESLNRVIILT